ncbi:MAG TPA: FAD-dependent oxidoreductase [Streptosporangiaceae bacterium]|jgi:sarcosine oxidase|nr:FAD-dependent oxidoreductase [Streptosporangiaceae bacterium]
MTPVRDVAIIGAGLLGLAAGRALAARGRDVVVLEQAEVGHSGSGSKGTTRIFRLGYPDPDYVGAARQARARWHELEAQSGRRILRPVPHLTFGTGLRDVHDAMIAAGAPCQLLQKADVAERFPAITVDGPALLEPDSAVIAADEALTAFAAGVPEIRPGVRVIRMADDGRQVTLHSTAGVIAARAAIVTAGPWSSGLLASVSVPIPGRPTLEQVAYLRPAGQDDAPIFVCHDEQTPYGVPVPGSRLYKIGIHPSGPATDPDAQNRAADQQLLGRLAEVARRYLPSYNPEPVTTERCVYDNSPDEDFIIDRIGNIVVGCGTSGHGFKFGPLLGEWLADLATSPAGIAAGHGLMQRFAMERFGRPD